MSKRFVIRYGHDDGLPQLYVFGPFISEAEAETFMRRVESDTENDEYLGFFGEVEEIRDVPWTHAAEVLREHR